MIVSPTAATIARRPAPPRSPGGSASTRPKRMAPPVARLESVREDLPVQNRGTRYGVATVLALVALRLVVGWHFFSEGSQHLADLRWSSEGFLRMAKGPLAPYYQAPLPDAGFGFDDTLHVDTTTSADAADVIDAWRDRVIAGLKSAEAALCRNLQADGRPTGRDEKDRRAPAIAVPGLAGRNA